MDVEPTSKGYYQMKTNPRPSICFGVTSDAEIATMDPKHSVLLMPLPVCDKPDAPGPTAVGLVFRMSHSCRGCVCNAVNALVKRHGVLQPEITREISCSDHMLDAIRDAYGFAVQQYYDAWLSTWPRTKQKMITDSQKYDRLDPSGIKPHVKIECGHDVPSRGRLIQAYGTLVTQAAFGPENRCFQKALGYVFDTHGYEVYPGIFATIGSGMSYPELALWMSRNALWAKTYYECDGKNWDSTMQRSHFAAKFAAMRHCCPELADFAEACFIGKGVMVTKSGTFRYKLHGTVKSGHNDTTSGNSIINLLISSFLLESMGLHGHILVCGDDLIIAIKEDFDCDEMLRRHSEFGIVPVGRKFTSCEDLTFISAHWLCVGDNRYAFVPLLGRLLSRLWWTMKPPSRKNLPGYKTSVALGLMQGVRGIPIYEDFLTVSNPGVKPVGESGWEYAGYVDTSIDGRAGVRRKYGLCDSEIDDLIMFIRMAPSGAVYAKHPVADKIIARDLADIHQRVVSTIPD